ncbi:hypothetical protein [Xenorhabdus szentirmaii]|uniref:Uncharacterized protein n=1 Tax=Xenorhabdus szentirmaii TaxID=290112 RepID=A0AAW3Z3B9_9GAMM|nr:MULTISPECIES: hypothetical protein [unclassified Xenorhabdus]MBD2791748.1 hypothetical protein [Xenorhabdus sp. CUL]MBD2802938.1 hypothetical protein [Xenorhabdus sp. M]MBD2826932.1 hypothetical protein [Xenorhabdus sp. 5]
MTREILGVNVLPLIEMLRLSRRYLALRKWRNWWRADMRFRKVMRQHKCNWDHFNFENRYRLTKFFVRVNQERGTI